MLKKMLIFIALAIVTLGLAGQAGAQTITFDILDVFDANNDGVINFGDSNNDGYRKAERVTKSFSLEALETDLVGTTATMTVSYSSFDPSSMDEDTYIKINGVTLSDFQDKSTNTQSWGISLGSINFGGSNSITIYLPYFDEWYGDHYENFNVNSWTLTYQVEDPAPVPVPSAGILLGIGLAGLTGLRRRIKG